MSKKRKTNGSSKIALTPKLVIDVSNSRTQNDEHTPAESEGQPDRCRSTGGGEGGDLSGTPFFSSSFSEGVFRTVRSRHRPAAYARNALDGYLSASRKVAETEESGLTG